MNEQMTDEQLGQVIGSLLGGCCCLVAIAALIALIVWLTRRGKASQQPSPPPAHVAAPPVAGAPSPFAGAPAVQPTPGTGTPNLSVLAVGFDARFRLNVEAATAAPPTAPNLLDARVELVHRTAKALLDIAPHWTHFGYGEKDLPDVGAAQQSYQFAHDDFRARAQVSAEPQGAYAVAILIIAARSHLHGVSTLQDRAQARSALGDRLSVGRDTLLGAELLWAPASGAISSDTLIQRFPEVRLLTAVPTGND